MWQIFRRGVRHYSRGLSQGFQAVQKRLNIFLSQMKRIKTIVDNLLLHKRHLGMPSWSWESVAGESETKDSWGKDSIPHSSLSQFLGAKIDWYNPNQDNNHPITNNLPGRQCLKNGRREEVPSEESEQLQRWSIPHICHLYQQCKYFWLV